MGVSCVSFIPSLRQYNLDQVRGYHLSLHPQAPLEIGCKGSANRTKYQIYLDIFEMQPTFERSSKIVQIERSSKVRISE